MKKIVILMVASMLLFSTAAFAVITGSKHDLSSSTARTVSSSNLDEICVFCHTPHGGLTTQKAPLWNRSELFGVTYTAADLYCSATLEDATINTNGTLQTAVQNSDAPLCLSCHNGGSIGGALMNQPASLSGAAITYNQETFTGETLIGSLVNDHPIGMDYSVAEGTDGELVPETDTAGKLTVGTLPLYGATGVMWCSSCHDVHDATNTPFLNETNGASSLCLTCHEK